MPCTNNFTLIIYCALYLSCIHAHADSPTVDAAIEAAKLKKANPVLVAKPEVKNEVLPSAIALAKPLPLPAFVEHDPKLWSIKGINNNYTAEIIINNKIHQVPLKIGSSFQNWEILNYDSESITLFKRAPLAMVSGKSKEKGKTTADKTIQLFASPQGQSILQYQIQQDGEINTLQRKTAANLPVNAQPLPGKN